MKRLLTFSRTTLVGGILFLVPIVVVAYILGKALGFAHKVVDPLAARIPVDSFIGLRTPVLLAAVVLVFFCFFAGLCARLVIARRVIHALEAAVLTKVPGYAMLKTIGESALGVESAGAYPVVLARFDNSWQLGLRVEELENGLVVVFVPGTPDPQVGTVHYMAPDRIVSATLPLAAAVKCLKNYGTGSRVLLSGAFPGVPRAK